MTIEFKNDRLRLDVVYERLGHGHGHLKHSETMATLISCHPPPLRCELEIRGKAQRVARPAQMRLKNSEVTGPKFIEYLPDVESGVSMRNRVAILPSAVECQRTE